MHPALQLLLAQAPVVTDGAWGTQLQARGLAAGDCPDHWNLTHPGWVAEVARAYVAAGSQVILTNTFRANRLALAGHGLGDEVKAINRAGVEISRRAAGDSAAVFGSVGPTGKMLLTGEVDESELASAFDEQTQAMAAAGVDALVIETMADLAEARIALAAAKTTGLPVVVSMVFDTGKKLDRTMMGVTVEQAVEQLAAAGADVIGANCGQGIAGYVDICRRMRAAWAGPIWIKPNAGTPRLENDVPVYETLAEDFSAHAAALAAAGATFIGGCCGTDPDFIRAVGAALNVSTLGSVQGSSEGHRTQPLSRMAQPS